MFELREWLLLARCWAMERAIGCERERDIEEDSRAGARREPLALRMKRMALLTPRPRLTDPIIYASDSTVAIALRSVQRALDATVEYYEEIERLAENTVALERTRRRKNAIAEAVWRLRGEIEEDNADAR